MKKQYRALRWLSKCYKVAAVVLFAFTMFFVVLITWTIFGSPFGKPFGNDLGQWFSFIQMWFVAVLVPFSLYGLGVLIDLLLSLEENSRLTARLLYKQYGEKKESM